jgi:ABC-type transport system involved in cytochrome c biogenesis permease component
MTLLPIVERELRVAARRRLTFWTRLLGALFALIVFAGVQIILNLEKGLSSSVGQIQFSILKWMSFIFACATGIFLTSDALSEEKREGTLGLLFLTDLRGYDVVIGKLISHSLQAFYGLLAAFPILGLTLLLGGVTGGEFWRAMLVICNTLFFSLAAGLLISSFSRDTMKAMNGTLLLCLFFFVGLQLLDFALAGWDYSKFVPRLSLASPGYLFYTSGAYSTKEYWYCLGMQQALGWGFLILSSVFTPRAWQEKTTSDAARRSIFFRPWRIANARTRHAWRSRLLDREPFLWLALRDRSLPRLAWTVTLLALILLGWLIVRNGGLPGLQAANFLPGLLNLAVLFWVALQACRFFVDAVHNGAMELILVTPLIPRRIVHTQWNALCRTFLFPALVVALMQVVVGIVSILQMKKALAGATVPSNFNYLDYQIVGLVIGIVSFLTHLMAVAWFGMWMGLTTRKTSIAVLKTICFVMILPWLGLMFVQGLSFFMISFAHWPMWMSAAIAGVLTIAKDLFFIIWSRQRLLNRFHETVAQEGSVLRFRLPPPLPLVPQLAVPATVLAAPPVVADHIGDAP